MAKLLGITDQSINESLKVQFQQGEYTVTALIGEGSSEELTAIWESPFEGDNAGSLLERFSGYVQNVTEQTTRTKLNSAQVWKGNLPKKFNLNAVFEAYSDAKSEVYDAVIALQRMASPTVNGVLSIDSGGTGTIPKPAAMTLGNVVYPEVRIELVSQPLDTPKTKDGYPAYAEVQINVELTEMLNSDEIKFGA